ncbi:5'-nucleotidase [Nephila pilipes]|uniref:5'-nucleotidase n=1 Tax=Nephila pilipes TaxID=299642 RepID=A0A8X6NP23_NEPPI|nr:5'-nucleotidase [Nephila pilipes]
MMEHSVENYDPNEATAPDYFLQVSGLKVVYDITKPPKERVSLLSVRARHSTDEYEPVNLYKTYFIAMPGFIAKGGDGYAQHEVADPDDYGQPEIFLIIRYLQNERVVEPKLDGRISFGFYLEGPVTSKSDRSVLGVSGENISAAVASFSGVNNVTIASSTVLNSKNEEIESVTPTNGNDKTNSTSLATPKLRTNKMNSMSIFTPLIEHSTIKIINSYAKETYKDMEFNSSNISLISEPGMGGLPKYMSQEEAPSPSQHTLIFEGGSIDQETSFITIDHNNDSARNVLEKNMVTNLDYEHTGFKEDLGAPIRVKLNRTINQLQQNFTATSSVEHNPNIDPYATLGSHTIWFDNNTIVKSKDVLPLNKPALHTSENVRKEFAIPNDVENFVIDKDEMLNFHQKNHELRDFTSLPSINHTIVNMSSEAPTMKNLSNTVNEEKRKNFSSLLTNSALTEFERVLMNAMLEEAIVNEVIIENGGADLLRHNLKSGLKNILMDKMDVTTLTSSDLKNYETTTNFNDPTTENGKSFETETIAFTTMSEIQALSTDSIIKTSDHGSTVRTGNQSNNDHVVFSGNEKNSNYPIPDDLMGNLKSNRQKMEEVKELLVDSVVDSVLEKVKLEFDRRASGSSKINEIDTELMQKNKRTSNKQLGSSTEDIKPTTDSDKLSSTFPSFILTDGVENGTQMSSEAHTKTTQIISDVTSKESSFLVKDLSPSYNSTANFTSTGDHKDNVEFAGEVAWIPWIL